MQPARRGYGYASAMFIIVLLLPFIYAAFFNFPEGDDFSPALDARHFFDFIGGIDHMFSAWWKWSGRYSFHFLWVFIGDVAEYRATYTAAILLSFLLLWFAVFGIAKELGKEGAKKQAFFVACFWLFAVLCSHGAVRQWYCLVELETLIAGYSFTLVYVWSLCRLWNRPAPTRKTKWFAIICCVLAAGFYEHSAPLVMAISIATWLLARLYDHPNRNIFFLLTKVSVVCFLIVYLARGNFRRQTKRGMTFAMMFQQLLNAGSDWWKYVVPAYCNPIYIAALFVSVWFTPRSEKPLTDKIPAPLILGGSAILFCGFSFALALMHAMSDVTIGEAAKLPANIAQYSIVFVFFALFACRDWLRLHVLQILGRPLWLIAIVALLIAGNSNFSPVLWNGIFGENARYAQAYEKRKSVTKAHVGGELAVMPLLGTPLPSLSDTLKAGFRSWPNKYAAPFYGLKALESKKPDFAAAYEAAEERGRLAWQNNSSFRYAYVASLDLDAHNATYRFDWVFVDAAEHKPTVRVAAFEKNSITDMVLASPEAMQKMSGMSWPFKRIFMDKSVWEFEVSGRTMYAVPLPLLDSAHSSAEHRLYVSFNGSPFLPLER